MAKQLSSTLRNLKFMQRATQKEEKKEEEEVKRAADFAFPASQIRKCTVIMEGDPHPGAIKGRMSFQSFNPSIDKLNEASENDCRPAASVTSSGIQNEKVSFREDGFSMDEAECSKGDQGDHKRKQSEVVSEKQFPNKSPKGNQVDHQPSPNKSRGSFKKPKGENLTWNVLRPKKNQNKRK